jgi:formate hydrogenlyase subunit 6/NADH:ubiquinone oxidoreductase subunit I
VDRYEELRQILHKHPTGAPKSLAFDEILRVLFTPEEVEVALGLGFTPRTVERVAEITGVPHDEVSQRCEAMADKGIVFSREKRGEMGYALLPTLPGLFEFPFMTGGGTSMHDRLAELWEEYHREGMGNEFAGSETPLARVIPIQETIPTSIEVLPYEEISEVLGRAETFGLAQCACRVSVAGCDQPRDVCLIFDSTAEYLIGRGFAERITRERAEKALRRSEEEGLVHTTNNSQDRLTFLCNCCPCCCTVLRGLTQLEIPNAFAKSRWRAKVDVNQCIGCGVCEDERCPVEAIAVIDVVAEVDPSRCIGCGLCVTGCEDEAVKMVFRGEEVAEPPATVAEMGRTIAAEKGKLESFLELMQR